MTRTLSNTRERLIETTAGLLWDRGYESMSPRAIMAESGAGQGSLYHHFAGKRELAAAALEEVADELVADLARIFDEDKPGLQRVRDWLDVPRKGLAGCKLGRLAMEKSVVEDDELRAPLLRYFKAAERALRRALEDAQKARQLSRAVEPEDLAVALLATVQGGYVLARAHRDAGKLEEAVRGARRLVEHACR